MQLHRRVGTENSYLPSYEDGTEYIETSAYRIQTPGITQKKAYNVQGGPKVGIQYIVYIMVYE